MKSTAAALIEQADQADVENLRFALALAIQALEETTSEAAPSVLAAVGNALTARLPVPA